MCHGQYSCVSDGSIFKDYGSIIISLFALIVSSIALFLNHRIYFKKTVKEKQLELIYELIGILSKNGIELRVQSLGGPTEMIGMSLYHFTYTNFKEKHSNFFGRQNMFFQSDSFDCFKFLQLMSNPFLPEEIYTVMDKFYQIKPKQFTFAEVEATKDFTSLITLDQKIDALNYFKSDTANHKSFENIHTLVVELYTSVNTWLEQYGAGDLKFKMNRKF